MLKLLKNMRTREILFAVLCIVLVVAQVYFDLSLPDYMTELTRLMNAEVTQTSEVWTVGLKMLGCAPNQCGAVRGMRIFGGTYHFGVSFYRA